MGGREEERMDELVGGISFIIELGNLSPLDLFSLPLPSFPLPLRPLPLPPPPCSRCRVKYADGDKANASVSNMFPLVCCLSM